MRISFSHLLILVCAALTTIMSCNTSRKATRRSSELPARVQLSPKELHQFNQFYHEALIRLEREEYDAHIVLLERALEIDSTAAEAIWLWARAQYMLAGRKDSTLRRKALSSMQKAAYYHPNDIDIQEHLAVMLDNEGRHEEALKCYELMARQHPTKSTQMQLAKCYWRLNKFQEALGVFNQMERQTGRSDEVIFGKLGIYANLKDSANLFAFLDTLIGEYPNEYEYQVYKGECYASMYNRPDSAEVIYKNVLRQSPSNKRAQFALMSHYATVNDNDNFFESVKTLISNNHLEEAVRTEILNNYVRYCITNDSLRLGSIRSFLDTLEYAENATGELSAAHVTLLFYLNADTDSTLSAINRTLRFHPENSDVRRQGLYLYYKSNRIDELIRLCEEGQYYDPMMLDYYHLPAIFYLSEGNDDAALATLERGEPYYMENPGDSLGAELYNLMGDLYHEQGKLERCYAAYDSALALVPDNPSVLNNYAYFLSLEKKDLNRALSMIHRANELSPNNASYLDTYAWVLYQLGQYTQAKIYIDQAFAAIKEGEESSTYYQHAGDIYWKIGDKKSARTFWQRAKELEQAEQ